MAMFMEVNNLEVMGGLDNPSSTKFLTPNVVFGVILSITTSEATFLR